MKNPLILLAVLLIIIGGVWVLGNKNRTTNSSGPIKIGVAVAQTGLASEWGENEFKTIRMMTDDLNRNGGINGQQVELVIEDTRSDPNGTTNAILKLATVDKVQVIIGPSWGDSFQGGFPIAETNKVVLVTPSAALESVLNRKDFSYLFSTWWPQLPEVEAFRDYLIKNNLTKVAILNDQDAFTTAIANQAEEVVKTSNQLQFAGRFEVPVGTKDYRSTLIKIKQSSPNAVYILVQDDSQYGSLMKQAKDLNLSFNFFSVTSAQNEGMIKNFKKAVDGLRYTYPRVIEDDAYKEMVSRYKDTYGELPTGSSFTNTINATNIVFETLRRGARSGTEIRDMLEQINIPGVGLDNVSFGEEHQIDNSQFEIRIIRDGKFVVVE